MSILALNYDNRVVANAKEMIDSIESQIDELDSAINKISSLNCSYRRQDEILDELRREKETLSNDLERLTGFKDAFGAFEERVKEVDNELAEKYSKLLSGNKMEKLFNLFTLDNLQVVLDVAGLVPVIGNIADGVNIVISALRGDMTGAVLSAVALIPIAGQVASGGKLALKYGDKASGLLKYGNEIFEWGKKKFKNGVEFAKKVWNAYVSDKRVYASCDFGGEIEKLKNTIKSVKGGSKGRNIGSLDGGFQKEFNPIEQEVENIKKKGIKDFTEAYTGGRNKIEIDDLAKDPSHGLKITEQGLKERDIGLALEKRGDLGKIIRDQQVNGGAEFIDKTTGIKWDVKSFESYPTGGDGKPITSPRKGAFNINTVMKKINKEFGNGHNIIIDVRKLVPEHIEQLRSALREAGVLDKIIWYP